MEAAAVLSCALLAPRSSRASAPAAAAAATAGADAAPAVSPAALLRLLD